MDDSKEAIDLYADHYPILRYFDAGHLPEPLREISEEIGKVARNMAKRSFRCPETSAGLRKLLEAKDCFVRAALIK